MPISPKTNDIIDIHDFLVEIYKEDEYPNKIEPGILNEGLIDLLTDLVQRKTLFERPYFPHVLQKAAMFLYYLNVTHPFVDGNKRTSLMVSHYYLRWNGYVLNMPPDTDQFLIEMAIPENNISHRDAYNWILKNTIRTIWDVLRGNILNSLFEDIEGILDSPFGFLLGLYAFDPLPKFINEYFENL